MKHAQITLIPGDSTGPEICDAVQSVFEALPIRVEWNRVEATDGQISDALLQAIRDSDATLMAFQKGQRDAGVMPPVVQLRRALGLFANVRPVHSLAGLPSRFSDVDLVVVRETSEDIYAHLEHESIPGTFESLKVTTRAACERITRFAYEFAVKRGRKTVTIVHKSNIMKKSDGLFLAVAREVAADYPQIVTNDCIVDALCMKLILSPDQFDVLLCGNLFGDIVADVCAGIAGGTSNCPSLNFGPDQLGLFAAPHGDSTALMGTGDANPLALLLPAVSMLRHLNASESADRLMAAIAATIESGTLPVALGGRASCQGFADAVRGKL